MLPRHYLAAKDAIVRYKLLLSISIAHPLRIGAGALGGMAGILTRCYVFDAKALGIDATQFTPTGP
jgi:hypothetical protein